MIRLEGKSCRPALRQMIEEEKKGIDLSFYLYSDAQDFPSQAYLRGIKKTLALFSIPYEEDYLDRLKSKSANLTLFKKNSKGHSVLLARPLRVPYEKELIDLIPPEYDPDMLTTYNRGKLFGGDLDYLTATSQSVRCLINGYKIPIEGRKVVVLGRSNEVGYPCFELFNRYNGAVTLLHSRVSEKTREAYIRDADILVLATGHTGLVKKEWLNPKQVIFDCGFNPQGGDLGFVPEEGELYAYTPVPGGVGALTSYCLVMNAILLRKKAK